MPPSVSHNEIGGRKSAPAVAVKEPSPTSKRVTREKNGCSIASKSPNGRKRAYTPPVSFQVKANAASEASASWSLSSFTTYIVEHQISLSFTLLAALASVHLAAPANSELRDTTSKFFTISYQNSSNGLYLKGFDDVYFVLFCVVVFTFVRALLMDYVFIPFARYQGIGRKASIRFGEQAWSFLYAGCFWTLGMTIMYNTKYWMNFKELWTDWPVREVTGTFKWYYLVQYAFWVQQIFVLNIEEKRKDFHQMLTHHIVTCSLIYASYVYHMTRVGNVILCVMDIVDILLPLAKMLKYLKFQKACDAAFGVFLLTWFFTRHVIYLAVIYSVHHDTSRTIQFGCYTSDGADEPGKETYTLFGANSPSYFDMLFRPQNTVCFTSSTLWGFLALLWFLEGITVMWFYMIMRVAIKVIKGGEAEDNRSEDEEEEEVEEMQADEIAKRDMRSKIGQELLAAYPDTDLGIGSSSKIGGGGSGFNIVSNGAAGPSTRRKKDSNGTPLQAAFLHGKERASQFISPQKLAESKIGCGGDDR